LDQAKRRNLGLEVGGHCAVDLGGVDKNSGNGGGAKTRLHGVDASWLDDATAADDDDDDVDDVDMMFIYQTTTARLENQPVTMTSIYVRCYASEIFLPCAVYQIYY